MDDSTRARFFDALWNDFVDIAPHAADIRRALEEAGETVANDHVAFRTFDRGPIALSALEPIILQLGYKPFDEYHFPEKHLRARAYLCANSPRIFMSELIVGELSEGARQIVQSCTSALRTPLTKPSDLHLGRPWPALPFSAYERLAEESEYAAWLCALGLRANHFTVSVNALRRFATVSEVLDFVEQRGYRINAAGGRVKGSPGVYLEQGSTMADQRPVAFSDGSHVVPTCYYEFALRHPTAAGILYEGFVSQSADKIFESTHKL